ncbi:MAG: hypothetical protein WB580_12135 [Candidatus Binataceae bacterium]
MKMPKVDCDAIEGAMRLHMVDVEGLLERVWAVGGFAGPPTDHEARLLIKQKNDKLTDDEWEGEDGLREIWQDQQQQMGELWHVEENLIAFLRFACCSDAAGARRLLFQWRSVRLAAHQAAVWYGRDKLALVDSALSKADIQAAKRTVRRGKPWPFVLFERSRSIYVSSQLHDWDEDNHERGCLALSRRDVCWPKSASDSTPRN